MKLIPISAGDFHCDGGALFGVIPKKLWSKHYKADEDNFTKLALRCLLVDTGEKKILIEAGIGNHYTEKHFENNGYKPDIYLEDSLQQNGYSVNDITDVFFTHLHWDHCTGAVKKEAGQLAPFFPNANYWCSKMQWEHSKVSNPREKAAYNTDILNFFAESGKLNFIEKEEEIFTGISVRFFHGHTPGLAIPFIHTDGKILVYTSDLIPTAANIPLLWIAAYDLDPVQTMKEKELFLKQAAENDYILFFEHDFFTECSSVNFTEKGFESGKKYKLSEWNEY